MDTDTPAAEAAPAAEVAPAAEAAPVAAPAATPFEPAEAAVRAKVVERRTAEHMAVAADAYQRSGFEHAIKRPYYHIKPLDEAQILNWNAYLSFEEAQSTKDKPGMVRTLYERSLVACANLPKMWIRYVKWLESADTPAEQVEEVFTRACSTFVPWLPEVHLQHALWYEVQAKPDAARKVYSELLERVTPGLLEAILQFANFERRQGKQESAAKIYTDSIAAATDSATKAFLAVHHAQFLQITSQDAAKVRVAFEAGIAAVPTDKHLWMVYIHFELARQAEPADKAAAVTAVFEKALGDQCGISADHKSELWQWRLTLEEDQGTSAAALCKTQGVHAAWVANGRGTRKRSAAGAPAGNAAKKARTGPSGNAAAQAAYAGYYGQQPQAAQQAPYAGYGQYSQQAAYPQQPAASAAYPGYQQPAAAATGAYPGYNYGAYGQQAYPQQ